MIVIMAIELLAGGIIVAREIIEARKVREQITQIAKFDAAASLFYEKFNGMPGDLLSAQAERMGLPTGDGTPAHSDGDGKLSACSPGWSESLGCETSLFWAQLAASELIPGTFTANIRFADTRVLETELLDYYLPKSTLGPDIRLTVWSSDHNYMSSERHLPSGNYYELTLLKGIDESRFIDDPYAISPLITKELDKKMDDGRPLTGKVIVNGANKTGEGWASYAKTDSLECVTPDKAYNITDYFKAHRPLCHVAIAIDCCGL